MSDSFHAVILFYNKPSLTAKCIDSLMENISLSLNSRYVISLVNNGSDAANLGIIHDKIHGIMNENAFSGNLSMKILSLDPNRGFSAGMNHGLKEHFRQSDEPVLCMSNDVELDPGFFCGETGMKMSGKSEIFCPHVYYRMDRSKPSYTHGFVDVDAMDLTHQFEAGKKLVVFPEYYPAAATVWTKGAFEKTGGFNEEFYCYWEDVELSYRCAKYGVPLVSSPGLKIYHLGRGTTSGKKSYYGHFIKGRELMSDILKKTPIKR